jgi:hypothetical protein
MLASDYREWLGKRATAKLYASREVQVISVVTDYINTLIGEYYAIHNL